ncbi:MAG TPA: guanylate kinase [Chitinophagaceae bacterium]|nr:guanylate kinase [Chitinophagaceae bacterium]
MESDKRQLVIITAPSGSGKTSIVRYLLQHFPNLEFSISACTRQPRNGEEHGVNYYFLSLDEFTRKIARHEFAEFEMVYEGKYYGTLKSELERIWNKGHIPLIDIDVQGALRLKKHYGHQALTLFIQAPDLVILEQRLINRNTETPESLRERIEKASHEMSFSKYFDHIVVNDILEEACSNSSELIRSFIQE